jgi:signal transduction histidine kinase
MTRAVELESDEPGISSPGDATAGSRGGDDPPLVGHGGAQTYLPIVASAFVILALLALVVTPVLMTWRLDTLRSEGDATTGRAHLLTDSLKTLFIDEIVLLERVRKGDTHSGGHYRRVRALQDSVIAGLREVAPRISTVAIDRVNVVARLSARWHTVPDAFVAHPISERQATGEMWRILADRDSMLVAEQQLDADIDSVIASRRALGGSVLRVQRWLSLGLGLLAVIATMVVAWFAQRARRLRRALARTIAISQQRRADLESITESKNRLMRGFSHDVKNPIGAADGYMQLLEEGILGPLAEKQRTSIQRARRSLHAALHLISDLLEIAQIEKGHIGIVRVPTDVVTVAREAAEQYRALAEAKGLVMHIDTSVEVPTIVSDPNRVRQVLANLISNAVKYTATGEVAVRVGNERDPEARGRISISVTDTGLGIDKDKQRLLFREFVRLDPTAGPGVGIGLAMSARIVEALGGGITVRSERGQGSVFVLWLPGEHADA